MEPKRSAFIGCGPRAREHADAYSAVTRGRVVAVCARTPDHAGRFAREFGIERSYHDVRAMLESERPDLVHIVTDPGQRVALMTIVAEHEVPVVIVEKPIALEGEDRADLADLARRSSTRFVVNTQLRFHPRLIQLQRDVSEGRIGDVRVVDASAGSTLLDQGVHLLDLVGWFVEGEPRRVFAQVAGVEALDTSQPCPDITSMTLAFDHDVQAHIVTGDIAPWVEPDEPFYMQKRIAAFGTKGSVHWTMFGWERLTEAGYGSGRHDYAGEDLRGQASLTDEAFALLDDPDRVHPTNLGGSLDQFATVLGAYASALGRRPVDLPCDPPPHVLSDLRRVLTND